MPARCDVFVDRMCGKTTLRPTSARASTSCCIGGSTRGPLGLASLGPFDSGAGGRSEGSLYTSRWGNGARKSRHNSIRGSRSCGPFRRSSSPVARTPVLCCDLQVHPSEFNGCIQRIHTRPVESAQDYAGTPDRTMGTPPTRATSSPGGHAAAHGVGLSPTPGVDEEADPAAAFLRTFNSVFTVPLPRANLRLRVLAQNEVRESYQLSISVL